VVRAREGKGRLKVEEQERGIDGENGKEGRTEEKCGPRGSEVLEQGLVPTLDRPRDKGEIRTVIGL
jgi:hypothetical protein